LALAGRNGKLVRRGLPARVSFGGTARGSLRRSCRHHRFRLATRPDSRARNWRQHRSVAGHGMSIRSEYSLAPPFLEARPENRRWSGHTCDHRLRRAHLLLRDRLARPVMVLTFALLAFQSSAKIDRWRLLFASLR